MDQFFAAPFDVEARVVSARCCYRNSPLSGVNLMALLRRLYMTCLNFASSANSTEGAVHRLWNRFPNPVYPDWNWGSRLEPLIREGS